MSLAVSALTAACNGRTQENYVFDIGSLSNKAWEEIDRQCEYEARRATASAQPGMVRVMEREELYILCLETKGVRYKGKVERAAQPPERSWLRGRSIGARHERVELALPVLIHRASDSFFPVTHLS